MTRLNYFIGYGFLYVVNLKSLTSVHHKNRILYHIDFLFNESFYSCSVFIINSHVCLVWFCAESSLHLLLLSVLVSSPTRLDTAEVSSRHTTQKPGQSGAQCSSGLQDNFGLWAVMSRARWCTRQLWVKLPMDNNNHSWVVRWRLPATATGWRPSGHALACRFNYIRHRTDPFVRSSENDSFLPLSSPLPSVTRIVCRDMLSS